MKSRTWAQSKSRKKFGALEYYSHRPHHIHLSRLCGVAIYRSAHLLDLLSSHPSTYLLIIYLSTYLASQPASYLVCLFAYIIQKMCLNVAVVRGSRRLSTLCHELRKHISSAHQLVDPSDRSLKIPQLRALRVILLLLSHARNTIRILQSLIYSCPIEPD